MKKTIICLILLVSWLLSACQATNKPGNLTGNEKILIIGNSHSVDAFHFLQLAFQEQHPDKNLTLGVLYYSGCSIDKHLQFAQNNDAVYRYYKNTSGDWTTTKTQTMEDVLCDQQWDIVILQAAKSDLDDTLNLDGRRALEAYINEHLKNAHEFMWHTSWPSPNDDSFFAPDATKPAPNGYKENLIKLYGFDPFNQYAVLATKATEHILTDATYAKALSTGAAIMHAYLSEGLPQTSLWRDYTHLNDYGRLIAAYALLAQLDGQPITNISINTISEEHRHSMFKDEGPLILTEELKNILISAANYSLSNPFTIPPKTAE